MATRYASAAGGGAHDGTSEANAWSWAEMIANCDGHYTYFKGNHTLTADSNLNACPGTVDSPTVIEGYASTIGDGYQGRANNGAGALVLTNFPVITLNSNVEILLGSNYLMMRCFKFVGNTGNFTAYANAYATCYYQCYASNAGNVWGAGGSLNRGGFFDCDGVGTGTASGKVVFYIGTGTDTYAYGCHVWNDNTSTGSAGIIMGNTNIAAKNVIYESAGIGIDIYTGNNKCFDNIIYKQGVAAIRTPNSARTEINYIVNNVMTDNAANRIVNQYAATANHPMFLFNNRSRDNGADSGMVYPDINPVTTDTGGAETDYIDAANDDLRPIPSSPIVRAGPSGNHIGALVPRKYTRSY